MMKTRTQINETMRVIINVYLSTYSSKRSISPNFSFAALAELGRKLSKSLRYFSGNGAIGLPSRTIVATPRHKSIPARVVMNGGM